MIFKKNCYKTHDGKFVAIVEVFKTWQYYLESCKHKDLMLIYIITFIISLTEKV